MTKILYIKTMDIPCDFPIKYGPYMVVIIVLSHKSSLTCLLFEFGLVALVYCTKLVAGNLVLLFELEVFIVVVVQWWWW